MKIKQSKLGAYLAVTAGASCAASVAEGAIQVVDLSGNSTFASVTLPSAETGDSTIDLEQSTTNESFGYLGARNGARFYSDTAGSIYAPFLRGGYTNGPAAFPTSRASSVLWFISGSGGGGFQPGLNYVAFKDTADNFGWLSFTLDSLTSNSTEPISSFGHFVYDDTSTSPANAIPLETAIAAAAVPEPSSLVLLALGATGLATRRNRKKAA